VNPLCIFVPSLYLNISTIDNLALTGNKTKTSAKDYEKYRDKNPHPRSDMCGINTDYSLLEIKVHPMFAEE
jgi:hypothetical protein